MQNKGQIYATDDDGRRLAPIYERLERAGARNVQVRAPRRGQDALADLAGACDLVLIDAPCTGTGAWRRNPDAKWRIRPGALEQRIADQDETLAAAARFVKPQGRILYVTCSLLREENEDRVARVSGSKPRISGRLARGDGGGGGAAAARRLRLDAWAGLKAFARDERDGRLFHRPAGAERLNPATETAHAG